MYFKTLGFNTLSQAGLMANDLKIGHYLKVPPRAVFFNQIVGTILGSLFNYVVNDVNYFDSLLNTYGGESLCVVVINYLFLFTVIIL